jgi:hypothetical protein
MSLNSNIQTEAGEADMPEKYLMPAVSLPDVIGRVVKRLPQPARREWTMIVAGAGSVVSLPVVRAGGMSRTSAALAAASVIGLGYIVRQGVTPYYAVEGPDVAEALDLELVGVGEQSNA